MDRDDNEQDDIDHKANAADFKQDDVINAVLEAAESDLITFHALSSWDDTPLDLAVFGLRKGTSGEEEVLRAIADLDDECLEFCYGIDVHQTDAEQHPTKLAATIAAYWRACQVGGVP